MLGPFYLTWGQWEETINSCSIRPWKEFFLWWRFCICMRDLIRAYRCTRQLVDVSFPNLFWVWNLVIVTKICSLYIVQLLHLIVSVSHETTVPSLTGCCRFVNSSLKPTVHYLGIAWQTNLVCIYLHYSLCSKWKRTSSQRRTIRQEAISEIYVPWLPSSASISFVYVRGSIWQPLFSMTDSSSEHLSARPLLSRPSMRIFQATSS